MNVDRARRRTRDARRTSAWQVAQRTVLFTIAVLVSGWLVVRLRFVLVHVVLAAILAAGMAPLVDRIAGPAAAARRVEGDGQRRPGAIPRAIVVLGLYLLLAVTLALGAALVLPSVIADTEDLIAGLPEYAGRLQAWMATLPALPFALPQEAIAGLLQGLFSDVTQLTRLLTQTVVVVRLAIGVLGGALNVILILVLALYMTHDPARIQRYLMDLLPPRHRPWADRLAARIGRRLADWLLGQLALSAIVGILCLLGLTLIGVRYALLLATVAAVGEAVPMVGPVVSAIPAVAVALLQSPRQALLVALLYLVVQQLENNLIVPRVMARAVAIHPLAVMLALLAGGELLGVAGAILAVPVMASAAVVLDEVRAASPPRRQRWLRPHTRPRPAMTGPVDHPHASTVAKVAAALRVDPARGLAPDEAARRLARSGPNALPEAPVPSLGGLVLGQFRSPLVVALAVAAGVSVVIGDAKDAAMIVAVLLADAAIGAFQEHRAQRALAALRTMSPPRAVTIRAGEQRHVPAAELVLGDVVLVRAGDVVPADGRLIEAVSLLVDESTLTGESVPVEKDAAVVLPVAVALGDRRNLLAMGTSVTVGHGRLVVTATGSATHLGRLAIAIQEARRRPTPLQLQFEWLTRVLSLLALAAAGAVFVLGLVRHEPVGDMFVVAVALAVAAVPEALPAVQTIVLALGVERMARRKAIVRRLPAVEALGAATTICTDKTGTLTLGEMRAVALAVDGQNVALPGAHDHTAALQPIAQHGAVPRSPLASLADQPDLDALLRAVSLCNDAQLEPERTGDPTERALLWLAHDAGLDRAALHAEWPRIAELPFSSDRKRMATLHRHAGSEQIVAYVKGAPEVILPRCSHVAATGRRRHPLDPQRDRWTALYERFAARGLRTLAVATREISAGEEGADCLTDVAELGSVAERDLTLLGIVALADPPRAEVPSALAAAARAGIRTVMITGDHPATAAAIAGQLTIQGSDRIITGADLDQLDDTALAAAVAGAGVYARVTPAHKVRIVEALQRRGEVVAMTGDGANDAPALRAADIGVAMGVRGTAVAREAADMILADDHYATIVGAVAEGRTIYANLRKVVLYLFSGNLGEVLVIFVAMVLGLPLPLQPIHILWVNLVTDGLPAIGLGMEPAEPGAMERPPRAPGEVFLPRWTAPLVAIPGVLLAVVTLLVFGLMLRRAPDDLVTAQTGAFCTLVIAHLGIGWAQRATRASSLRLAPHANPLLAAALVTGAALLVPLVTTPLGQSLFHTRSLDLTVWLLVLGLAPLPFLSAEAVKAALRRTTLRPQDRTDAGAGTAEPPAPPFRQQRQV